MVPQNRAHCACSQGLGRPSVTLKKGIGDKDANLPGVEARLLLSNKAGKRAAMPLHKGAQLLSLPVSNI